MNGAFSPFSSFEIVICLHVGFDDNHQFNLIVTDLTTHMIPFLLRTIANLFVFFVENFQILLIVSSDSATTLSSHANLAFRFTL